MKQETAALLGQQVGHIRVVDVLGEGGMGAVTYRQLYGDDHIKVGKG